MVLLANPEPRAVRINGARQSRIHVLGKIEEAVIENCDDVVILFEVAMGLEIRSAGSLTVVAGGSRVPTVGVRDSNDISFIANYDAMSEPLETFHCADVSVFAVQGLPITKTAL
jgi:hypothetical protein